MELLLPVRREEVLDNDEAEEDAEIGGDIEEGEVQDLDAGSEDDNVQEGGDEQSEDETLLKITVVNPAPEHDKSVEDWE